jgi:hypothetical protein
MIIQVLDGLYMIIAMARSSSGTTISGIPTTIYLVTYIHTGGCCCLVLFVAFCKLAACMLKQLLHTAYNSYHRTLRILYNNKLYITLNTS